MSRACCAFTPSQPPSKNAPRQHVGRGREDARQILLQQVGIGRQQALIPPVPMPMPAPAATPQDREPDQAGEQRAALLLQLLLRRGIIILPSEGGAMVVAVAAAGAGGRARGEGAGGVGVEGEAGEPAAVDAGVAVEAHAHALGGLVGCWGVCVVGYWGGAIAFRSFDFIG